MFAPPSPGSAGDQLYFSNAPTHDRDTAHPVYPVRTAPAKVAELVDALDLESSGETRESSSLSFRTSSLCGSPLNGGSGARGFGRRN